MDHPPINPKPVIEPGADERQRSELTTHALDVRIRQQEILAELGHYQSSIFHYQFGFGR